MKLVVWKNYLWGQILYINPEPVKKRRPSQFQIKQISNWGIHYNTDNIPADSETHSIPTEKHFIRISGWDTELSNMVRTDVSFAFFFETQKTGTIKMFLKFSKKKLSTKNRNLFCRPKSVTEMPNFIKKNNKCF